MNSNETYRFTATASGVLADFSHLTLYNGNLDTVLKGYGRIEGVLPKGLYKLVLVLNDTMIEKFIKLVKDTDEFLTLDFTSSSVLATGLGNTHEYYSERAQENYSTPTTTKGDHQVKESIFLFFRYPDEKVFKSLNPFKESLGANFQLLDQTRKLICKLEGIHIKEDIEQFGYLIFHIRLRPGTYYLHYGGRKPEKGSEDKVVLPPREIPITVFQDWQTQCFMTFGKGPIFKSMFVAMRSVKYGDNYYDPDHNNLYDIEGILQKFNNGIYYLPPNVLNVLTYGKWENPILGLLAAYAYFKSGQNDQEALFHTVLRNLPGLLGDDMPDVVALKVLAANHYKELIPFNLQISEPCMFLPGMRAVLESGQNIIQAESIAEIVVDKFFSDMVWTSYAPPTTFRNTSKKGFLGGAGAGVSHIPIVKVGIFHAGKSGRIGAILGNVGDSLSGRSGKSYLPPERKKQVNRKPKILGSWIAYSLMDILSNTKFDFTNSEQLATQLRITSNMLNQTINEILENEDAIDRYLTAKRNNPDYQAFNPSNFERLKNIRLGSMGSPIPFPELTPA